MATVGYCHDCSQTVSLEQNDEQQPICSRCHGEFVEIVEPEVLGLSSEDIAGEPDRTSSQQQRPQFQVFPFPFPFGPVINQQLNAADGTAGRNAAIITGNDPMEMLRLLNSTMNQLIPGFAPPPAAAQPHSHNTTASSSSGEGETSSGESGMDTSSSDEQQTGSGTEDEEQTRQQQQQQQPWPGFGFPLPFGIQQPHSGQPRTGRQQGVMMSVSIGPDGVPRRQFRRFGGGNGSSTAATRGRTRSPGQEGEERPARRPADEEETETEGETQAESSQENLSGLEEMPEFTGILRQLFGADVLGGFGVHFGGGGAGSGAEATGMEGLPEPLMRMFGMVGNPGDYVFGNQGLDDIISRLMEQTAGKNAPPPAEDEEINQLPRCQITAEEKEQALECAVCKDEFKLEELDLLQLPCHHKFHQECIKHWLKINGTCPVCRRPLKAAPATDKPAATGGAGSSSDASMPANDNQPPPPPPEERPPPSTMYY